MVQWRLEIGVREENAIYFEWYSIRFTGRLEVAYTSFSLSLAEMNFRRGWNSEHKTSSRYHLEHIILIETVSDTTVRYCNSIDTHLGIGACGHTQRGRARPREIKGRSTSKDGIPCWARKRLSPFVVWSHHKCLWSSTQDRKQLLQSGYASAPVVHVALPCGVHTIEATLEAHVNCSCVTPQ